MQKSEFVQRAWACERKLYRIARTMLNNDADCEDAVQEALLRAWSKIDTLRESAWFETWLVRILINECRQIWRKKPRAEVELIDNITADIPEGTPVIEAILALPKKVRIAMVLHYVEGYPIADCANLLGITQSAVKARLFRGRTLLKNALGEEFLP